VLAAARPGAAWAVRPPVARTDVRAELTATRAPGVGAARPLRAPRDVRPVLTATAVPAVGAAAPLPLTDVPAELTGSEAPPGDGTARPPPAPTHVLMRLSESWMRAPGAARRRAARTDVRAVPTAARARAAWAVRPPAAPMHVRAALTATRAALPDPKAATRGVTSVAGGRAAGRLRGALTAVMAPLAASSVPAGTERHGRRAVPAGGLSAGAARRPEAVPAIGAQPLTGARTRAGHPLTTVVRAHTDGGRPGKATSGHPAGGPATARDVSGGRQAGIVSPRGGGSATDSAERGRTDAATGMTGVGATMGGRGPRGPATGGASERRGPSSPAPGDRGLRWSRRTTSTLASSRPRCARSCGR
jgi:hypothetical protein